MDTQLRDHPLEEEGSCGEGGVEEMHLPMGMLMRKTGIRRLTTRKMKTKWRKKVGRKRRRRNKKVKLRKRTEETEAPMGERVAEGR